MSNTISRRRLVGAMGAGLILPNFEGLAQSTGDGEPKVPTRLIYIGMGFGVVPGWFPNVSETTANYKLPKLLQSLDRHKESLSVIQNLSPQGRMNTHGGSEYYLSDAPAIIKNPSRGNALISCDQVAAKLIGQETRFPSLALAGAERGGIGHGPTSSLSWGEGGRPISGIVGALGLYKQLYGGIGVGTKELHMRLRRKKSVLDLLVREIKSMNSNLSAHNRDSLDQYTTSLREIEEKLVRSYQWSTKETKLPNMAEPKSNLSGIEDVKLTYDLLTLALQADLTRVATYMLPIQSLVAAMGHKVSIHEMSHNRGAANKKAAYARDVKNAELFSYFLDKLKAAKQPDGRSLLDHSMIAYGTALRYRHTTQNVPMIFAGHGGGDIRQGMNVNNQRGVTPLTNLWFSMLHHVDPSQTKYSSSKNTVSEIFMS